MPTPITSLLDRTTPERVPPLDLDDLARRSRRRQHRHRAALGASVVTVVAVLAAAVVGLTSGGDDPSDIDTAQPGDTLTEPVGSWSRAADPPFAPRGAAFGGTLDDGRVLIWGGQLSESDEPALDGGIYDPQTGQWNTIPDAPLPPLTTLSPNVVVRALTDDRLAVVGTARADGTTVAAVYDVAEQRWHEAPSQDEFAELYDDAVAWDGETLVVMRSGSTGEPLLRRWRPGDDQWSTGAAPPATLQEPAGVAFDGERLAVAGAQATGGEERAMTLAIYHVAEDRWAALPAAPLPSRQVSSAIWSGGRLLVGGGATEVAANPSSNLRDLAAYDPASGTWETLEGPPEGGVDSQARFCSCFDAGDDPIVQANPGRTYSTDEPLWFLGEEGWELAPLRHLHRLDDVIVATSEYDLVGVGPVPYEVRVRAGRDRWLGTADAPFEARMAATVVATGDRLLVLGGLRAVSVPGQSSTDMEPYGDAWVFDLSGD